MRIVNKKEFKKLNKGNVAIYNHFFVSRLAEHFPEFNEAYNIDSNEDFKEFGCYIVFDSREEKKEFVKAYERSKLLIELQNHLRRAEAPSAVFEVIKNWKIINKSPYSYSFYDANDIDWGCKPEGSLRISDHWNFESCGEKHCKLDTTEEYIGGVWILAKYENGIYKELKRF